MEAVRNMRIKFWNAFIILLLMPLISNAQTLYVSEKSINVRSGPGLDNTIVAVARMDQPLRLLGESGGWYRVELPGGKQGWISNRVTKTEKPALYVIRDLKKRVLGQERRIETLLGQKSESQKKFNRQFVEFQELKLKFKILRNENNRLKKARDYLWLAGGVLFALLIWTMGFLAGQYKVKKDNRRFYNMAASASGITPSSATAGRGARQE